MAYCKLNWIQVKKPDKTGFRTIQRRHDGISKNTEDNWSKLRIREKKVIDDNEDLLHVITACFEALKMINMITFSHFDLQFRDILNYHEFFIFHLIFILNLTCSDQLSWKCPCPLLTAFFFFATLFENCKLTYAYPNAIETCLIPNYFFLWKTVIISL